MRKQKKSLALTIYCLTFLLLTLVAVGCSSESSSNETNKTNEKSGSNGQASEIPSEPKSGGTITVAFGDEPDTLDMHKTGMAVANTIAGNLGGGLVSQDPETLEFKPYLAKDWKISEDGKTWTFSIRNDVTFHDGTKLTAKVFKETYERALDPDTAAKVAGSNLSVVESVSAPDDETFVLQLKEPFAPLLQYLSDPGWLQPLSLEAITKHGDQYGRNPIGVGPWVFEGWETGQSISFTRNEDFNWAEPIFENEGPAEPDKLVFKFIKESQTKLAALESGSVDVATRVDAKDAKKYFNSDRFEVLEQLRNGLGLFLEMNMDKEVFQDINVRKALNLAVNKNAIVQAVLEGEGVPAHGYLPPTYFGYDPAVEDYGYKFNQEEAIKLLEKSGYKKNNDGYMEKGGQILKLDLLTMEGTWSQSAQLLQAMYKDIGVKIDIVNLEWGALAEAAGNGNFDLTLMGYTFNDPDVLYLFLHSSQAESGINHGNIRDEKVDELLEEGRTTVDTDARKEVYSEVQQYLHDQAYWVPIFVEKQFHIANKRVEGLKIHPYRQVMLFDGWVNE